MIQAAVPEFRGVLWVVKERSIGEDLDAEYKCIDYLP
jgi:hypothetical protein